MNHQSHPSLPPAEPDIPAAVAALAAARHDWRRAHHRSEEPGPRELPAPERVAALVVDLRGVLFPMRLGPADLRQEDENAWIARSLNRIATDLLHEVRLELAWIARRHPEDPAAVQDPQAVVAAFVAQLGAIRRKLDKDVVAAYRADPAARSVDEVLLSYPGIRALIHHRIAHALHGLGVPLIARLVAEIAHSETGIDIHPGATMGEEIFIDHGTGVVIGATATIGDRVTIYQAVTLGARSFPTDGEGQAIKGAPRHPVVEDDVVIYAGATVLGRVTIGRGAVLGGNVWVTADVPPGARVSQARHRSDAGG